MDDTHYLARLTDDTHQLAKLTDDYLLFRLRELLRQSRRVESELVAHIGEVDERKLYAREAWPSMFAYCTKVLHLSEAEAYLRIAAARAARAHPPLLAMLADGRLHLSALVKLAPHLTPTNRDELLRRAAHRSKREVEELVAELTPRADVASSMRRLPGHGPGLRPDGVAARLTPLIDPASATGASGGVPSRARPGATTGAAALRSAAALERPALPALPVSPASVEPLAPSRYKIQFTADAELRDKLERLRDLLRHDIPDGDLGAVIGRAVSETLERLEARRFAKRRSCRLRAKAGLERTAPATSSHSLSVSHALPVTTVSGVLRSGAASPGGTASPGSRHIPAALRRAVYERDGGQCRYVDRAGRRCSERGRLEFHHRHPFGMGGVHSLDNLGLLCRVHNAFLAERDYGRRAIAAHRLTSARADDKVLEDTC